MYTSVRTIKEHSGCLHLTFNLDFLDNPFFYVVNTSQSARFAYIHLAINNIHLYPGHIKNKSLFLSTDISAYLLFEQNTFLNVIISVEKCDMVCTRST